MRTPLVLITVLVGLTSAACGASSSAGAGHSATAAPTTPAAGSSPSPSVSSTSTTTSAGSQWLSYHASHSETAAVPADPALRSVHIAWSADLGGVVHGEPVAADGRIVAATETDRVVALSPQSGHILWSRSVGTPLRNVDSVAGCGDIDPLGITGTPVIDPATDTVYVVAEVSAGGSAVHHVLDGLSLATGAVTVRRDVDPPLPSGESAVHLLQRPSLSLANGKVYVAYGGNDGDCGVYHGWVVAVADSGHGPLHSFEVASDGQGGAVWEAGGAPAVASNGDVYVSTGNANPDPPQGGPDPEHYTESVVELSPDLQPLASFKDTVAGGDEDLATSNPVLLPDGDLFAIGKTDIGYVLRQQNLTEVAAIKGICGSDPDGGPAFDASADRIYVPCRNGGIQEVDLHGDSVGGFISGANSAPILIGQDLWAAQYPGGTLTDYDTQSGRTLQTVSVGSSVPTFATPSTADGLLLIGTNRGVTALR